MDELLSLKWKNHGLTFLEVLRFIRNEKMFSDVTLACNGKFYSVHKIVLTACSDYFKEIFCYAESKNPIVILKDIESHHLESLLDYMYMGEVNVTPSDLPSIIKAAECLKIKGLNTPVEQSTNVIPPSNSIVKRELEEIYPEYSSSQKDANEIRDRYIHEVRTSKEMDNEKEDMVKEEVLEQMNSESLNITEVKSLSEEKRQQNSINICHSFNPNLGMDQFDTQSIYSKTNGTPVENSFLFKDYFQKTEEMKQNFPRTDLFLESFSNIDMYNQKNIMNPILDNSRWMYSKGIMKNEKNRQCPYCVKSFPFQSLLKNHVRLHTGEKPFQCKFCSYNSNQKGNLKTHLLTIHNLELK